MKISELSEKYGIDRRSIDYWTNLGLIYPDSIDENGYSRHYGPTAEKQLKKILIAKAMSIDGISIKECVDMLDHLPAMMLDTIVVKCINDSIDRVTRDYKMALKYVQELKEEKS